jgi:hypothetical protein
LKIKSFLVLFFKNELLLLRLWRSHPTGRSYGRCTGELTNASIGPRR